jgi:cell division protein FtsQ
MSAAAMPVPFDVKLMNVAATALFVLGLALFAAAAMWWAVRHPVFAIAGITVQGEVTHNSAPTLRANVAPQLAGNFFTINLAAAREAFESVPWVRQAIVRREFPNRLRVQLQEHHAVALWGGEDDPKLLGDRGEVFEANVGDVEQDDLPHLSGPDEQAAQVLAMYRAVKPLFEPLDLTVQSFALTPRGNWQAELDNGAAVELGRGTAAEVTARTQRFVQTVTQVASRYGRTPEALVSADLRYGEGYALHLRGVATKDGDQKK